MAVDFSCLLFVASGVVIFTMVCCSAPGCANHSDKSPDGVSFHSLPLSDPDRLAKWLTLMRREDFIPRPSSRLCSEHFEEDCFEPGFLLKREFARGDGSYARKPKRTLKVTAIPTRFAHTHSLSRGDARPVSASQRRREECEREEVPIRAV